jgi:hypothetical protein
VDPKDLKRFKNESADDELVRESKKVDNVLRYIVNERTKRTLKAATLGQPDEELRFAKLLKTTPEGEGFLLWQKMALMGEIGNSFDINEKYTNLKNFNFQGHIEDHLEEGIETNFLEAVDHSSAQELMFATLMEGSPDCVRWE